MLSAGAGAWRGARVVAVAARSRWISCPDCCSRRRSSLLDRAEPVYLFVCAGGRAGRVRCAHSGRSPRSRRAGSCAGSRGAPRWASDPLRSSTRCRGRSAPIHRSPLQLTGDSARPGAADLRVVRSSLPAARRRGHHQARRSSTRAFFARQHRAVCALLKAHRLRRLERRPISTTGSSRCWRP